MPAASEMRPVYVRKRRFSGPRGKIVQSASGPIVSLRISRSTFMSRRVRPDLDERGLRECSESGFGSAIWLMAAIIELGMRGNASDCAAVVGSFPRFDIMQKKNELLTCAHESLFQVQCPANLAGG